MSAPPADGGPVSALRRPLMVSVSFACHAAGALLLASPVAALIAGTGVGRLPQGDRALFEPGGLVLAEVGRKLLPALPGQAGVALLAGALLFVLLLVPHAALLSALARPGREALATLFGRALGHLPALLSLSGLTLLAQTLLIIAAATVGSMLEGMLGGSGTPSGDLATLVVLALGAALALGVGVFRDLCRAAVVAQSLSAKASLFAGIATLFGAPGRVFVAWAVPATAGLALIFLGSEASEVLDVSRPGSTRLWLVAALHQLVAYALAWCQATWLSASLRLVGRFPSATA